MEFIDIIDENGRLNDSSEPRDKVHQFGLKHRTVHIWILNKNKELLIQKRALAKENYGGKWDISCAGHISAGETSLDAARKELREELGVIPENPLQYIFSNWSFVLLNDGKYKDHELNDVYILEQEVEISNLKLQQSEVSSVKLIYYKDLQNKIKAGGIGFVPHKEEYDKLFSYLDD